MSAPATTTSPPDQDTLVGTQAGPDPQQDSDSAMAAIECCPGKVTDQTLTTDEAGALSTRFKALSDPVRLQLVSLVASAAGGEVCACDLPPLVDRSQSTVSHHLPLLVQAGILDREQRGRWAWFSVRHDILDQLAVAMVTVAP